MWVRRGPCALGALCVVLLWPGAWAQQFSVRDREPMQSARKQLFNDTWRDWVDEHIKPLPYVYETPIRYRWDEMEQPSPELLTPADVVLMTQASPERLPFVRRALSLWMGPAALAVFIPFPEHHPQAATCRDRVLSYMHNTIRKLADATGQRAPPTAMSLLYANNVSPVIHCRIHEESDGLEPGWTNARFWHRHIKDQPYLTIYDYEYPVGAIRQLALDLIPDDRLVFLMDADFVFPPWFAKRLLNGATGPIIQNMKKQWQEAREKRAIIIPAFERNSLPASPHARAECARHLKEALGGDFPCWMYAGKLDVPSSKSYLQGMVQNGTVFGFYENRWVYGHSCYDPRKALAVSSPYDFEYVHPCEPYIVALKAYLPRFDERWRGRDMNKINYLAHVWAVGTRYTTDTSVFLVHLPHSSAESLVLDRRRLPRTMKDHPHYARATPLTLTRIFMHDIAFQENTTRGVTMGLPRLDNSRVEAMLRRDRENRLPRVRPINPWRSGLLSFRTIGDAITDAMLEREEPLPLTPVNDTVNDTDAPVGTPGPLAPVDGATGDGGGSSTTVGPPQTEKQGGGLPVPGSQPGPHENQTMVVLTHPPMPMTQEGTPAADRAEPQENSFMIRSFLLLHLLAVMAFVVWAVVPAASRLLKTR